MEVFLLLKGDFLKGLVISLTEHYSFLFLMLVDLYPTQGEANVFRGYSKPWPCYEQETYIESKLKFKPWQ